MVKVGRAGKAVDRLPGLPRPGVAVAVQQMDPPERLEASEGVGRLLGVRVEQRHEHRAAPSPRLDVESRERVAGEEDLSAG